MDFKGQYLAEKLYQYIILIFAVCNAAQLGHATSLDTGALYLTGLNHHLATAFFMPLLL